MLHRAPTVTGAARLASDTALFLDDTAVALNDRVVALNDRVLFHSELGYFRFWPVSSHRRRTDPTRQHRRVFPPRHRAPDDGKSARARPLHLSIRQTSRLADIHVPIGLVGLCAPNFRATWLPHRRQRQPVWRLRCRPSRNNQWKTSSNTPGNRYSGLERMGRGHFIRP